MNSTQQKKFKELDKFLETLHTGLKKPNLYPALRWASYNEPDVVDVDLYARGMNESGVVFHIPFLNAHICFNTKESTKHIDWGTYTFIEKTDILVCFSKWKDPYVYGFPKKVFVIKEGKWEER